VFKRVFEYLNYFDNSIIIITFYQSLYIQIHIEDSMNSNSMAVFAIIASVGLLTLTIASTTPTMTAFANGDKCISGQADDGSFTFRGCGTDKQSSSFSGDANKQCRESGNKCSSSQTGFGTFDNN